MITFSFNEINNSMILKWDSVNKATSYKINKRIIEYDNNFTEVFETDTTRYIDKDIIPKEIFPPDISCSINDSTNKVTAYISSNLRNIKTYEYMILAYDENNVLLETIRDKIELFKIPNRYYYCLKIKGELPKEYHASKNGIVIFNSLEIGEYTLYATAEYNTLISDYKSYRIKIDKSIYTTDKRDIPNAKKNNNRYRGPHESIKQDTLFLSSKNNIDKLKKRFEELSNSQEKQYSDINYNSITNVIDNCKTCIEDLRRNIKYEKHIN